MVQIVQRISERSNEVLSYWHSLKRGKAAPSRQDVQPSALKHILPDLFIAGWSDTDLRFRLAGTRICELFDAELRDSNFLNLFRPTSRDCIMDAALNAFRNEEAIHIDVVAEYGGEFLSYELLLMPLRSPNGICDRLLGGLFSQQKQTLLRPLDPGPFIFRGWLPCPNSESSKTTTIDETLRAEILGNAARAAERARSLLLV